MYGEKMAYNGTGPGEWPEAMGTCEGYSCEVLPGARFAESARGYLFYPKQKLQNIALKTQVYLFFGMSRRWGHCFAGGRGDCPSINSTLGLDFVSSLSISAEEEPSGAAGRETVKKHPSY